MNVSGERTYDMGKLLVEYAVSILDQDAQARGHIAGCNSIFLETLASSPPRLKVIPASAFISNIILGT